MTVQQRKRATADILTNKAEHKNPKNIKTEEIARPRHQLTAEQTKNKIGSF